MQPVARIAAARERHQAVGSGARRGAQPGEFALDRRAALELDRAGAAAIVADPRFIELDKGHGLGQHAAGAAAHGLAGLHVALVLFLDAARGGEPRGDRRGFGDESLAGRCRGGRGGQRACGHLQRVEIDDQCRAGRDVNDFGALKTGERVPALTGLAGDVLLGDEEEAIPRRRAAGVARAGIAGERQDVAIGEQRRHRSLAENLGERLVERAEKVVVLRQRIIEQRGENLGVHVGAARQLRMAAPDLGVVDDDAVVHDHGGAADHRLVIGVNDLQAVGDEPGMTDGGEARGHVQALGKAPPEVAIAGRSQHLMGSDRVLVNRELRTVERREAGCLLAARLREQEQPPKLILDRRLGACRGRHARREDTAENSAHACLVSAPHDALRPIA